MSRPMSEWEQRLCNHCGGLLGIRNPMGFCDHLYYPDACKVCDEERKRTNPTEYEKLESWARKAIKAMKAADSALDEAVRQLNNPAPIFMWPRTDIALSLKEAEGLGLLEGKTT